LTDSEKEIYEQAYSKKLQKRKFKYAVGSFIVGGVILAVLGGSSSGIDYSSSGDICFDPICD